MPANKEHTEATPSSLAVAAGEYLDYLAVERGLARNTIAAYRRDLTTYCAYLERVGIVSFEEVTRQVVEGFVADRRDGGYSDASVERALAAVKGLHAFLVRDGAVAQNPTAALRLPKKAERLPEYLSVEDVSALLDQDFPEGEMGLARPCHLGSALRMRFACERVGGTRCGRYPYRRWLCARSR